MYRDWPRSLAYVSGASDFELRLRWNVGGSLDDHDDVARVPVCRTGLARRSGDVQGKEVGVSDVGAASTRERTLVVGSAVCRSAIDGVKVHQFVVPIPYNAAFYETPLDTPGRTCRILAFST